MTTNVPTSGGIIQTEISSTTLTADGTEQDILNETDIGKYEGYIDLSNMALGDSVTIKEYVKLKIGGNLRQYATNTYTDAQTEPVIHQVRKLTIHGIRITLEQTAGVNRDYDYNFLRED